MTTAAFPEHLPAEARTEKAKLWEPPLAEGKMFAALRALPIQFAEFRVQPVWYIFLLPEAAPDSQHSNYLNQNA
jgi:hypothetical protein